MNILREISIKTELVISSIIFILSIIEIAFLIETLQFTPKSTIWEENGKWKILSTVYLLQIFSTIICISEVAIKLERGMLSPLVSDYFFPLFVGSSIFIIILATLGLFDVSKKDSLKKYKKRKEKGNK